MVIAPSKSELTYHSMENEINETIIDSTETNETPIEEAPAEETPLEQPQETPEEKPQETPEAKYARLTRQAEQLARKHGFQPKPQVKSETQTEAPSLKDYVALKNANIHEDDVEDVMEYAKFKKIPISEALKSSVVRASIKEKEELRDTANATNTSRTRTPNSRPSGQTLLDKAQKTGEIPESTDALNAMLDARYDKKK